MGQQQICVLFVVLFLTLASLALILTSIVTDFWFTVNAADLSNAGVKQNFSYHFGMWRKCFTDSLPPGLNHDDVYGDCVYTYRDLGPLLEDKDMTSDEERDLHLERSWIGCAIACAGVQLFTLLVIICGLWPGDCKTIKTRSVYLAAAIMILLAGMCGIASGISFIALRDIDENTNYIYPKGVDTKYDFSFYLAWVANGLCMVEGFMYLFLLKTNKDDDTDSKHSYYSM